MMKKKNYFKLIAIILCLVLICISVLFLVKNSVFDTLFFKEESTKEIVEENDVEIREKLENELEILFDNNKKRVDEGRDINKDYIGQFMFESGIIDEGVVQTYDNDYYLRKDWVSFEYSVMGSIIMDYECELDDKNITLYGHTRMDYKLKHNETEKFSPLKDLLKEKNYKKNKYAYLITVDGARKYEVAEVFILELERDGDYYYTPVNMEYYLTEYNPFYFADYKENIKKIHAYDTGVTYSSSDNFLTLQTCVEEREDCREIVLLKEISRYKSNEVISQ